MIMMMINVRVRNSTVPYDERKRGWSVETVGDGHRSELYGQQGRADLTDRRRASRLLRDEVVQSDVDEKGLASASGDGRRRGDGGTVDDPVTHAERVHGRKQAESGPSSGADTSVAVVRLSQMRQMFHHAEVPRDAQRSAHVPAELHRRPRSPGSRHPAPDESTTTGSRSGRRLPPQPRPDAAVRRVVPQGRAVPSAAPVDVGADHHAAGTLPQLDVRHLPQEVLAELVVQESSADSFRRAPVRLYHLLDRIQGAISPQETYAV